MTRRTAAQRRLIIDDLATILRKPTAQPTITPAELIAVTLSTTQWVPGRLLDPDDIVVQSILKMLKDGGYAIIPATKEDLDATE
jgi:hypothetical protein